MCFPVSYAGFFAIHNNLFFNISFLYVCLPPLKNDGRGELRFLQNEIRYCPPFLNKGKKCSETGEKYGSDENLVEVGSVFQRY